MAHFNPHALFFPHLFSIHKICERKCSGFFSSACGGCVRSEEMNVGRSEIELLDHMIDF